MSLSEIFQMTSVQDAKAGGIPEKLSSLTVVTATGRANAQIQNPSKKFMPTFNDSENKVPFVPEADYILCVTDFEIGISNGSKTSGCEKYDVTFEVEGKGSKCFEQLIDHPNNIWKIDTFLKSAGITLKKGESYSFNKAEAEEKGIRWINPIGLRMWARLHVEEYSPKGSTEKRKKNKVSCFYTDKAKLPPNKELQEAEEAF